VITIASQIGKRPRKLVRKASAQVLDAIRNAIFSGELEPGDPIPELHVARQCRVSQTTVREALAKLEHAGLVRRVANRGSFVTKLSADEFREHIRLRLMLESLAAHDAALTITERDFSELDRLLGAIADAVESNDYFETAQADLEFHRFIWTKSGDSTLYRILDQLTAPLFAFASIRRRAGLEDLRRAVHSHQPISAALKRRDPEAAAQEIRIHIEASYRHEPL
jgi:DNA-binding GntR family transcriptional regulator